MNKYRRIRRSLKAAALTFFILFVFSAPFAERGAPRAQIDGVCVMYCDDGGYDGGGYDSGGYGYGGGGCAAYDPGAYYSGPSYVGEYHPDYANVVWDGEYWTPANGYEWVSSDENDWRVQRIYGSPHPDHPNVIWNGEKWQPADGYTWYSDAPDDYRVIGPWGSHPVYSNVVWNGDKWEPAAGYAWANDIQGDFTVVGPGESHGQYPNVIWNGDKWEPAAGYAWANDIQGDYSVVGPGEPHGQYSDVIWNGEQWTPAPGYRWANDTPGDYTVIGPGDSHPEYSNVVWNGDSWSPADGYVWANDIQGNLQVITKAEAEARAAQQVAALPTDRGLKINEVPSPSGYRTAAERQAQLDRLTDEQIDTELVRIRNTLVRMKADFEANTADLGDWLKEAEQAEFDALKDSFGLLVGGSLERFKGTWDAYPRLKAIASNGLDYAGKLELSMKVADDPENAEYQREIMREMMMDVHKTLVEEGDEMLSQSGPNALAFTKFLVDYGYHMTRWGIARNRITAISDNLDKPNGALEAQKRIKTLQEELIRERDRRRTAASSS